MTNIKALIAAVRADPRIGRGTVSFMDETHTDTELASLIRTNILPTLKRKGYPITEENVVAELIKLENWWREVENESAAAVEYPSLGKWDLIEERKVKEWEGSSMAILDRSYLEPGRHFPKLEGEK